MRSRRAAGIFWLALVAAATAALFLVSRGKWSDPIVDSGREWIVPDALSRGELLYRDVVYWFGPFTPYWHALFFRLAGSGFPTLVLAGAATSIGIVCCLYAALRLVTGAAPAAAWTAIAIPWLVFMPDAGGAILGMGYRMWHAAAFGLLALWAAIRLPVTRGGKHDLAAGFAAGAAGLCRTEWGIAVLAGVAVAIALRAPGRPSAAALIRAAAGFLVAFGGGIGFFLLRAGPDAILRDAPVLLFNLPPETRTWVAAPHPSGWALGAVQMAYCAFAWLGALVLLEMLARSREPGFARKRLPVAVGLLVLSGICVAIGGFPNDVLLAGTPLLCAASVVLALRSPRGPLAAALGSFGIVGALAAYRRPFFLADAAYVAPPVLFAIVCAAACLERSLAAREGVARKAVAIWLVRAVVGLGVVLFGWRALQYGQDTRVPIPGTGGMLSARPDAAREISAVAEAVRTATKSGEGLVVFPEGEILNLLADRPNPIRHKLYLPGYLDRGNEAEVLEELKAASPGAFVIWPRVLAEYGGAEFGVDYGQSIRAWIQETYAELPVAGAPGRSAPRVFRRRLNP